MNASRPDCAELLELLEEVFEHGPDVPTCDCVAARCFYCHADAGDAHGENCAWLRVADVLGRGDSARAREVGDDDEDWADRVNGDLPPPSRRTSRPRPPVLAPDDPAVLPPEFDAAAASVLAEFERDVAALGTIQPATLDLLQSAAARIRDSACELLDEIEGEDPLFPTLVIED
jgi:hypothetical protein